MVDTPTPFLREVKEEDKQGYKEEQSGDVLQPIFKPYMPATCRGEQGQLAASGSLGTCSVERGSWNRSRGRLSLPPPPSLVSGIMNSARAFWVGNKLEARGRGYPVLLVTFHGGDVHHLYKCPT